MNKFKLPGPFFKLMVMNEWMNVGWMISMIVNDVFTYGLVIV